MSKKVNLSILFVLILAMVMSACAPAATPTAEAPVEVEVATEVPTMEPTAVPVVVEAPDFEALYSDLIANNPKEKGYGTVAADALNTELVENPDLFLLDVREPAELEADGYISGSVAVPMRQVMDNLDKLPALDSPIIVYCKSGHRGALVMDALQLVGYTNVRNLAGGIGAWKNAELPVEMSPAPAPEVLGIAIIENEALFTAVRDFMANIPENSYATGATAVNEMLVNSETFTLVDVRRADEYEAGYIETAISLPLEEMMANLNTLPEKDAKIVIYCKSGHRGAMAAQALLMNGYTNVVNMGGGINAWIATELPVVGAAPDFGKLFTDLLANNGKETGYGSIATDALNTALVETPELFLLDVREPAELEADGYIMAENFANIPVRQLADNLDKLPSLDTPIVVYCKSGHRGTIALAALQLLGYSDVRNLGGGLNAWNGAELAVEKSSAPVTESISTPIIADQALFTAVKDYLNNLPEGFYNVDAASLNEMIVNGEAMTLVDIRPASDYAEGYIEGAINIPFEDLMTSLSQLPDKAAKIVVYCGSGQRSGIATSALVLNGYTNIANLGGGLKAWKAAELPVVQ